MTRKSTTAISGYLAFVAALLLTVIAANQAIASSSLIIGLLAASLPALVVWLYVESIPWEGLERARQIVRGVVSAVALALSLGGFLVTLWSFSRVAVFVVILETAVWYLLISGVFYLSEVDD